MNGGPLPKSLPKHGAWNYQPKYNGWRALVHIATGAMFNRKLEPLSISGDFKPALDQLRVTLDCEAFKWADCEALERRHNIGRGTLVVLDCIPEPKHKSTPLHERQSWLRAVLKEAAWDPCLMLDDTICVPPNVADLDDMVNAPIWDHLQTLNKHASKCAKEKVEFYVEFYEGVVAKRCDSIYPMQLRSPDIETPWWVKHRWQF